MSQEDSAVLDELRFRWHGKYAVNYDGVTWTALPQSAPETVLSEPTAAGLDAAMQRDHVARAMRATAGKRGGNASC